MGMTVFYVKFRIGIVIGVFLFMLLLLLSVWGCSEELPVVDMHNIDKSGGRRVHNHEGKKLKVAVAAMISPEVTRKYYNELLELIACSVDRDVEFIQRQTYAEISMLLEEKKIDMAFVCSGPYAECHDRFGLEILAVPVVNGEKSLLFLHYCPS